MAYYQGDYYMGDYYQGDPFLGLGKLWSGIKKVGKGLLGIGGGGASREDVKQGIIEGIAQARIAGTAPFPGPISQAGVPGLGAGGLANVARAAGIGAGMVNIGARAFRGVDVMPGQGRLDPLAILPGGRPFWTPGECPRGFHKAKDESQRCVRNRRMNVTNPRALRRGLRRVAGFGKLAQRARRDIGRAATAVGAGGRRGGPVARHHARIRAKA